MKLNKVASVEDYKIVSSFQSLRKTLMEDKFADRLEKPLAYWALPNDRRLPLAFLGRTIKDLLATPFEELSATPGIGQKKISSLVKLLSRATKDNPPAVPFGISDLNEAPRKSSVEKPRRNGTKFDPAIVSEALWTQWRETVERQQLGQIKLGRLAPTLQALPTVIWHTPLEHYLHYSVSEIRHLKTHGEKRVRVVLEVFYIIHDILGSAGTQNHLAVRLAPKFIEPLETWIAAVVERPGIPSDDALREALVKPLLNQVHIDSGPTIHDLSAGRLGAAGQPQSVRQQAKRMGVTRARVYQLLEDCSKVMSVRWPEGELRLHNLLARLQAHSTKPDDLRLLHATMELFFPGKHKLTDGEAENGKP